MPTRNGGCLCGAVRYECSGEPQFALQCHCRDCQRQSGASHVAAVRMPVAGFRVTQGAPQRYVARSDAGNEITRVFCGDCGTPLYVQVSTRPDIVGLRVCTFDDPSWFRPDANIFVKSAQPWDHLIRQCRSSRPIRPADRTERTSRRPACRGVSHAFIEQVDPSAGPPFCPGGQVLASP